MARYLFRFGSCTPAQWSANEARGWDDESSSAMIFVEADSPEAALAWGANWIEDAPEECFSPDQLERIPEIRAGEFPDFGLLAQS